MPRPLFAAALLLSANLAAAPADQRPQTEPSPSARDLYGDPLPPGAVARLGTFRLRSGGGSYAVAFSPDGTRVAWGGADSRIGVLNLATGVLEADFDGGTANYIAFSPAGDVLAIISGDKITLLDRRTRRPLRSFSTTATNPELCFSQGGRWLAAPTAQGVVSVYDVASGRQRARIAVGDRIYGIACSANGSKVALANGTKILHVVNIVDQTRSDFVSAATRFHDVAFSADGSSLAAAGPSGTVGNPDGAIWVWDLGTRRERVMIRLDGQTIGDRVLSIAYAPTGDTITSGARDGRLRIWDAHTGSLRRTIDAHDDAITRVVSSPDGSRLASASLDGTVRLWTVATGEPLTQTPSHRGASWVAFSRDSRRIVSTGGDTSARVWEVATGKQTMELRPHNSQVTAAVFAESAGVVVSSSWNTFHFWNLATGELQGTDYKPRGWTTGMAVLPDGRTVLTGDEDGLIRFWDASSRKWFSHLEGRDVSAFAASGDAETLVAGGFQGALRIWRRVNGSWRPNTLPPATLWDKLSQWFTTPTSSWVTAVAMSRDGRIVAAGRYNGELDLWSVTTGTQVREVGSGVDTVRAVGLSNDGALLAWYAAGDFFTITEVATGRTMAQLRGHRLFVRALEFAPDGRHLASASDDGTMLIWDLQAATDLGLDEPR